MSTSVSNTHIVNGLPAFDFTIMQGVNVPSEYIDPFSKLIMLDPVIVNPSGRSFDRLTIEKLDASSGFQKEPISNQIIRSVVSNRLLKTAIDRFLALHPSLKKYAEDQLVKERRQLEIIEYTVETFANLFVEKGTVTFEANQKFRISGVNLGILWEHSHDDENPTLEVIDNILLPYGLSYTRANIHSRTSIRKVMGIAQLLYLPLSQSVISAARIELKARINDLFERMMASGNLTLVLQREQVLAFQDVPVEDLERLDDFDDFKGYLQLYKPPLIKNITITFSSIDFEKKMEMEACALYSQSADWSIRLIPHTEFAETSLKS